MLSSAVHRRGRAGDGGLAHGFPRRNVVACALYAVGVAALFPRRTRSVIAVTDIAAQHKVDMTVVRSLHCGIVEHFRKASEKGTTGGEVACENSGGSLSK